MGLETYTVHPAIFQVAQFIIMGVLLIIGAMWVYRFEPQTLSHNVIYAVFGFNNLCIFIDSKRLLPLTAPGFILWFLASLGWKTLKLLSSDKDYQQRIYVFFIIGFIGDLLFAWPFSAKPVLESGREAMWTAFFHVAGFGIHVFCNCISTLGIAFTTFSRAIVWSSGSRVPPKYWWFMIFLFLSMAAQIVGALAMVSGCDDIYLKWEEIVANPRINSCGGYLCSVKSGTGWYLPSVFITFWLGNPIFAAVADSMRGKTQIHLDMGYVAVCDGSAQPALKGSTSRNWKEEA